MELRDVGITGQTAKTKTLLTWKTCIDISEAAKIYLF